MAKARALDKRRKAIRNIRKITRTMELIATARFKKAMDRAVEADAFTRKIAELAADEFRKGLLKLRRTAQERMNLENPETVSPRTLINSKTFSSAVE